MPMELCQVRDALVRRLAASQEEDERAARTARAVLPQLVAVLAGEFGARRVVLFGSLTTGLFRPDSDIDLAVEGVANDQFMSALARATEVARRKVDLIELDWVDAALRQKVLSEGEILYVA